MSRITDSQIAQLRALPIEGVAQRLGLSVTRHVSLCPFHDDRHPSLHFNVSRNTYKCYVCDAHGGPIDLVMNHLHKDFPDACRWLADGELVSSFKMQDSSNLKPETWNLKPRVFDPSRYLRYFERPYLNPAARRFLFDERRLDPRVIRWCRITSWQDRNGNNWLQTPYYDPDGKLTGIQWRNLVSSSKFQDSSNLKPESGASPMKPETSSPRFRFPKGAKCGIYNLPILQLLQPEEPLYIAEGCSDCWSLLSAGHKAIAIPSATTLHQNELKKVLETWIVKLGAPLHIYPDQDIPGEKLYLQLTLLATQAGLPLIRHSLPPGCKDFSDYYLLTVNAKPS